MCLYCQNGEITWGAHFLRAPISALPKSREKGSDQSKMEGPPAPRPSPGKSSLTWPGAQAGRSRGKEVWVEGPAPPGERRSRQKERRERQMLALGILLGTLTGIPPPPPSPGQVVCEA